MKLKCARKRRVMVLTGLSGIVHREDGSPCRHGALTIGGDILTSGEVILAALGVLDRANYRPSHNLTCGDCVEGRCHWGGVRSRESVEAARTGRDFVDPDYGRCSCERHEVSVLARERHAKQRSAALANQDQETNHG